MALVTWHLPKASLSLMQQAIMSRLLLVRYQLNVGASTTISLTGLNPYTAYTFTTTGGGRQFNRDFKLCDTGYCCRLNLC